MMKKEYTDGFFCINEKHGFLPIKDPLEKLPERYYELQVLINNLPNLISCSNPESKYGDFMLRAIEGLEDFSKYVEKETDIFIIQALYRAYTFLTSAYLLLPVHMAKVLEKDYSLNDNLNDNNNLNDNDSSNSEKIIKKARNILPIQLAKPLTIVSDRLNVYPWLDYHYAYSLGNYVKINKSKSLHLSNLKMACSFTRTSDETGFIMNHVYINEKSPELINSIFNINEIINDGNNEVNNNKISLNLKLFMETMIEINNRRKTMWKASNPDNYNNFRSFIMGIKGNEEIFGPGVLYIVDDSERIRPKDNIKYKKYRGQTGAQDDIIPTVDIFTGIIKYYPNNQLTSYLEDLRSYRPKCVQEFFKDLQEFYKNCLIRSHLISTNNISGLVYLLSIVNEVYLFRNGHWQFVQRYIMKNTKYPKATGGTPIISWIPNQIEACLKYMNVLINDINNAINSSSETELKHIFSISDKNIYNDIKNSYGKKVELLDKQLEELKNKDFNISRIYELNQELNLNDQKDFVKELNKHFSNVINESREQNKKLNEYHEWRSGLDSLN